MKRMSKKFISVVIPVYNNSKGLMDTLDSIVAQDFSKKNYEIVISDNGSNDNTLDTAEMFAKKYPELIHIVVENNIKSSYAARNKGIGVSNGEILSFIDADETVEKDFLKKICKIFQSKKIDYLGCQVELVLNNLSSYGLYNKITGFPVRDYMQKLHFAPTCCLSIRRKVLDCIGIFDSRMISGGDYEFGHRAYRNSFRFYYCSETKIFHPARTSFKQLLLKAVRTGRGLQQLAKYYPKHFKHLNRYLFDPRYFFPNNSKKIYKQINKLHNFKIGPGLKLKMFFIDWCIKIAQHIGYIYQKVIQENYKEKIILYFKKENL